MNNLAKILENKPNTRLVIENFTDPGDGSISLAARLQDVRTGQDLVEPVDWFYSVRHAIEALNKRCKQLAKEWSKPMINTGV